jgi:hypothetical protein
VRDARREVLGVDATSGKHPHTVGERELGVAPQQEHGEPFPGITQQHDRGRGRRHQRRTTALGIERWNSH